MKTELIEKIAEMVQPVLQTFEGFLVDISISGERGTSIVEVFIDTDQGVTADQCALVSRTVASDLDTLNLIPGRYRLEVSSPGLDRPLKLSRQFRKNIGRRLRVVSQLENIPTEASGTLEEVSATSLTLLIDNVGTVSFPLERIQEVYVIPQIKKRV